MGTELIISNNPLLSISVICGVHATLPPGSGPNKISKGPSNVPWINFFISGEGWHKIHHEHPRQLRLHKYDTGGFIAEKLFT